ncbi:Hydrophobin-B [Grifola frondosa]|uniref:Hydrophobin n=1 Tax=Grifola frondosa TaxID=5627 RepID=A0A1C7ML79_GRIFR|nr:Hydrophobin-B [Grifola frondosa]
MFGNRALFATTSLALLAAAIAQSTTPTQCDFLTSPLLCCQQVVSGDLPILGPILQALGIPLPGAGTEVGLNCSSTNSIEVLLGACATGDVVCCDNNDFGGIIALGCQNVTGLL